MDQRSDATLLEAWRTGDDTGFEALVDRHQGPLLRHAHALLGGRREAEDVVQDALLRLANQPPQLRPEIPGDPESERSAMASWLHRVTRNLCLDAMRTESRRRRREETAAQGESTSGGIESVEADDTRAAVERGLAKLPADQREVLALRLFGERSYREIAAITGKKIGTIGWLISVGLKALSRELAPVLSVPLPATSLEGDPS